jgi:hypothetical protein
MYDISLIIYINKIYDNDEGGWKMEDGGCNQKDGRKKQNKKDISLK